MTADPWPVAGAPPAAEPARHNGQPWLNTSVVLLRAPTQVWSAPGGRIGAEPIHGVYFADTRMIRAATVMLDDLPPEPVGWSVGGASRGSFAAVPRHLLPGIDPRVRLDHERVVEADRVVENVLLSNATPQLIRTTLSVRLEADFSDMQAVKSGSPDGLGARWRPRDGGGGRHDRFRRSRGAR